jgi:hypothetical protein
MKIIIDKSKFYVLAVLLVLFIGAFVYAGAVNSEFSGAPSAEAFGHDFSCITVTSDENNNVDPGNIGAPNSFFQKDLEIIDGDSPDIMAVYCPSDYVAVGGGMFAYEGDEGEVEAYVNMPTKGIKNYFTNGIGGLQKDLEGWVCGHDDLTGKGSCSVICCKMG